MDCQRLRKMLKKISRQRIVLLFAAVITVTLSLCDFSLAVAGRQQGFKQIFQWENIPAIPDAQGLEGSFCGVANDALIVAGGSSVTRDQNGNVVRNRHDDIFVLTRGSDKWLSGGKIPSPLSHGTSITTDYGLLCLGGSDSQKAYKTAFLLQWCDGQIKTIQLPDMPQVRTGAAGAISDNTIYVMGGQSAPATTDTAAATVWKLELVEGKDPDTKWDNLSWQEVESWPGPPRSDAMAAAQDGNVYLFGGYTGEPQGTYLNDAYKYNIKEGWKRVADIDSGGIASASAIKYGDSHIFVFGGIKNDSTLSSDILAYHTITNTWIKANTMPAALAGAGVEQWLGKIIIFDGVTDSGVTSNNCYSIELSSKKPPFGVLNAIVLAAYLVSVMVIGAYCSRREKTIDDFFIGGHRVPWWAAGVSIIGTQISSISFMATPAKAYATDWFYYVTVLCIIAVQPLIVFFYLPFYRRLNITSVYEYLEKRFSLVVRLFGGLSFILFQCGRMTIVLFLPSLALSAVSGLNIYLSIILMGILTTVYTVMGGVEAVVWCDLLQVIALAGGALTALVIIVMNVDGGLGQVIEIGMQDGKFKLFDLGWDYTMPVLWVIVVGNLFLNMLSYSADQAVVQRYLVTKDEKSAAKAIWTNAVIVGPISLVWFCLGAALYAFYKTQPQLLDPMLKTDQIFPLFIAQQLPDGVIGLVIAGLFSAAMSTIDGSLNSISTVFVVDFYKRFNSRAKESTCLHLARFVTGLFGFAATAIAMWMAFNPDAIKSLWDIYMTVLGLIMSSLAGLFALGIFTRRANSLGAMVGAIVGAVMLYAAQQYSPMHFFLYSAVGVTGCFVSGYIVSVLTGGPGKPIDKLTIYTINLRAG